MEESDSVEIHKSPEVVQDAQEEMGKLDVLVCGKCHSVCYYIEQFQEHKQEGKCTGTSNIHEDHKDDDKPQVWAFMLWKNAQFRKAKEGENKPTSWAIYQDWCKLSSTEKDTWVVAGENIRSFTKVGTAQMQEIKSKTQSVNKNKIAKPSIQVGKSNADDEPLEEGEIRLSQLTNAQRVAIKAHVAMKKSNSGTEPSSREDSHMDVDGESEKIKKSTDIKKVPLKPAQQSSDVVLNYSVKQKPPDSRKALRTLKTEGTEETLIEKVLSKRFNQKKKCIEYLVKWENLNDTENTWEPRINFEKCKTLIEEFDRLCNKAKMVQKSPARVGSNSSERESVESDSKTTGRPQRTSKQKALNQVKAWCGDITEGDEAAGKRKSFSDDDGDSSDSFEKKIKLEEESDSSEDEKPSVTIRKIVKPPSSVNGVAKRNLETTLPTTQRVVRVSQKQLPSLSSGVYIMSKTEGIIKLDSNTPSTGSPLLKVGQKIGQTHIKVVKKDAPVASNSAKPVPKLIKSSDSKPFTSTPKPVTKIVASRKSASITHVKTKIADTILKEKTPEKDLQSKIMDDDSDGLEELEFPTDLPLPEPDSPPGEFSLCPLTGKLLGQPDEPQQSASQQDEPPTDNSTASLDNLVKLAAAELPDVHMDNTLHIKEEEIDKPKETLPDIQATPVKSVSGVKAGGESVTPITTTSELRSIVATSTDLEASIKPSAIDKLTKNIVSTTNTPPAKPKPPVSSKQSILNAALTNARVTPSTNKLSTPKKLLSTPSTVRQKVTTVNRSPINRPVQPRPTPATTIIHKITPSRNRPVLPKTFNNDPPILNRTSNVTTYKPANVARRIGNTTIYKTSEKSQNLNKVVPTTPTTTVATSVLPSAQPTLIQATSTANVINMPLLTQDEEPSTSAEASTPLNEIESLPTLSTDNGLADLANFSIPESDSPLLLTGDDGTIYQIAGQNEEGQTILISDGPEGQHCVIVESPPEDTPILMTDNSAESEQIDQAMIMNAQAEAEPDAGEDSQVVAQIVKADPPSPGGTRKVVLMLPDGSLMMTDVTAEQYAALELDK